MFRKILPFILLRLPCICWLLVAGNLLCAQSLSEIHWHFGTTSEGIRFNKSNKEAGKTGDQENASLGQGGSAVATDPLTGNLLFYTDGSNILDAKHQNMSALSGINDHNQSAAIAPVPGQTGQYYVFYKNTAGSILYAIVDTSLGGNSNDPLFPLGDVTTVNATTGVVAQVGSEAMVVLPGEGGSHYLLVQSGTDYETYEIGASPVLSTTPVSTLAIPKGLVAGNFAYNQATGKIAVAPANPSKNIQLLDFDPATGALSSAEEILNTGSGGIYDTEWSKDGKSLFISSEGQLYHYYSDTVPPQRVLAEPVFKSYGLKRGPDNKIYHLYQQVSGGPLLAGRINSPDSVTAKLSYQALAFDGSDFGGRQFPEFLPDEDIDFALDFVVVGNCANGLTKFIPEVNPLPESYEWTIADTVIHALSPEMTFEEGGFIPVQLIVETNGKADTVSRQVMIENNEMQIDVPSDTTICADQLPGFQLEAKVQPEGAQLTWSHGQTGPTATFDSTGYYYVVAVNPSNGCEVYAGVNIKICQEEKSRANIWYFGEQAGLDFNDYDLNDDVQPPVAITDDNKMDAPAGAAAISDRNGQVLFYTNGETVWNREHEIMANGDDIGGDINSTQSSLVIPFPGDETMFYIFTTTQGPDYQLGYAIVDIKGEDGNGAVEEVPTMPASYTTPLFSRSTEKITAITSGDTTWLLMHELGNNTFRAYPITQGGIGIPVLSSVGSDYSSAGGYMKFSTNGQKVASAVQGPPGFVEIYSFNDSTGMLDDSVRFDFGGEQPYGVEFSPNTDLLYVTTSQGLYQFHVSDTLSTKEMQDSKKLIESGSGFGALQTGPTGQIYMAVDGSTSIKYISSPNVLDTDTTDVQTTDFSLEGRTSKRGLPNFVQNMMEPLQEAGFEVANACLGDSVIFSATERCDTDKFSWSFGDGNTATGQDVTHQYAAPGKYLVTLVISNPCAIPADTTIADTVEVFAPPPESDFPEVYGLCGDNDSLKVYNDPAADLAFEWSNGLTGNAIPVSVPGDYSVRVTNGNGCSITKDFQAVDARPRVDLGPDQVVCQDEELDPLNARNTGATYQWTILRDGANFAAGTSQRQEISTELPGEYLYVVSVTEPENFGGCQKTDSVYITVNDTPQVEAIPTPTTACGAADGGLALNILSAGDYAYSVRKADGADIASGNIPNAPASITPIENLAAGIYVVEVTDNISGCMQTLHAEVEDGNANFTIDDVDPLCGNITVTVSNSPVSPSPLSYTLYNEQGTAVASNTGVNANSSGKFTITDNDIVAGIYSLEVTAQNGTGCTRTFTGIEVLELDLSVTHEDGCEEAFAIASSETESALVLVSYAWTNIDGTTNGIKGNPNIPTVGFDQSGRYVIRVSASGYCDNVDTVDITVGHLEEEDLAIVETGDSCLGEVTLTVEVNVPGNYSYLWEEGGQRTQSITVTESGEYFVRVRDTDTGCEEIQSIEVEVFDPLEVMLTAEPACENQGSTMIRATVPLTDTTGLVYSWSGPGGEIPGERGDSLVVTESGSYQVTVNKAGRACPPAKDDISVSFSPVGISTLPTAVQIICISDPDPRVNSVLLDPDSLATFSLYRWQLNGKPLSSEKTVLADKAGIYSVTMITREGCSVTSQVEVIEDCKPQVFIPSAFRPGSGIPENRVFQIFNKEEIDPNGFQVFIFNRWGELIYQSPDKNFQWDGTFKGEPVQTGTYAYVIRYIGIFDPDKTVEEERGAVMVIR